MKSNEYLNAIINRITEEQILQMLEDMNVVPYKKKHNEIWFQTICHNGHTHKLCYFRDSKSFYCYTNCGKMSLFNFLMNVKNITFKDAVRLLGSMAHMQSRYGINNGYKTNTMLENLKCLKSIKTKNHKEFNVEPISNLSNNILNYFDNIYYQGWIDEGITIETMQKYNIKWYGYNKHIIIPHYNINNKLVGIRRRSLLPEECVNAKYMPEVLQNTTFGHSLGLNLYGLNINKEAIKRRRIAIITEAEKNVLKSDVFFGNDSVAVAPCGFTVSNWQRDMLINLGVKEVVLAFDKDFNPNYFENNYFADDDEEYKKYLRFCDRLIAIGDKFNAYCRVSIMWDRQDLLNIKDSPFDKGVEVFKQLYHNREKLYIKE